MQPMTSVELVAARAKGAISFRRLWAQSRPTLDFDGRLLCPGKLSLEIKELEFPARMSAVTTAGVRCDHYECLSCGLCRHSFFSLR